MRSPSDRLYELALDFEWRTGVPFAVVLSGISVAISAVAITITVLTR